MDSSLIENWATIQNNALNRQTNNPNESHGSSANGSQVTNQANVHGDAVSSSHTNTQTAPQATSNSHNNKSQLKDSSSSYTAVEEIEAAHSGRVRSGAFSELTNATNSQVGSLKYPQRRPRASSNSQYKDTANAIVERLKQGNIEQARHLLEKEPGVLKLSYMNPLNDILPLVLHSLAESYDNFGIQGTEKVYFDFYRTIHGFMNARERSSARTLATFFYAACKFNQTDSAEWILNEVSKRTHLSIDRLAVDRLYPYNRLRHCGLHYVARNGNVRLLQHLAKYCSASPLLLESALLMQFPQGSEGMELSSLYIAASQRHKGLVRYVIEQHIHHFDDDAHVAAINKDKTLANVQQNRSEHKSTIHASSPGPHLRVSAGLRQLIMCLMVHGLIALDDVPTADWMRKCIDNLDPVILTLPMATSSQGHSNLKFPRNTQISQNDFGQPGPPTAISLPKRVRSFGNLAPPSSEAKVSISRSQTFSPTLSPAQNLDSNNSPISTSMGTNVETIQPHDLSNPQTLDKTTPLFGDIKNLSSSDTVLSSADVATNCLALHLCLYRMLPSPHQAHSVPTAATAAAGVTLNPSGGPEEDPPRQSAVERIRAYTAEFRRECRYSNQQSRDSDQSEGSTSPCSTSSTTRKAKPSSSTDLTTKPRSRSVSREDPDSQASDVSAAEPPPRAAFAMTSDQLYSYSYNSRSDRSASSQPALNMFCWLLQHFPWLASRPFCILTGENNQMRFEWRNAFHSACSVGCRAAAEQLLKIDQDLLHTYSYSVSADASGQTPQHALSQHEDVMEFHPLFIAVGHCRVTGQFDFLRWLLEQYEDDIIEKEVYEPCQGLHLLVPDFIKSVCKNTGLSLRRMMGLKPNTRVSRSKWSIYTPRTGSATRRSSHSSAETLSVSIQPDDRANKTSRRGHRHRKRQSDDPSSSQHDTDTGLTHKTSTFSSARKEPISPPRRRRQRSATDSNICLSVRETQSEEFGIDGASGHDTNSTFLGYCGTSVQSHGDDMSAKQHTTVELTEKPMLPMNQTNLVLPKISRTQLSDCFTTNNSAVLKSTDSTTTNQSMPMSSTCATECVATSTIVASTLSSTTDIATQSRRPPPASTANLDISNNSLNIEPPHKRLGSANSPVTEDKERQDHTGISPKARDAIVRSMTAESTVSDADLHEQFLRGFALHEDVTVSSPSTSYHQVNNASNALPSFSPTSTIEELSSRDDFEIVSGRGQRNRTTIPSTQANVSHVTSDSNHTNSIQNSTHSVDTETSDNQAKPISHANKGADHRNSHQTPERKSTNSASTLHKSSYKVNPSFTTPELTDTMGQSDNSTTCGVGNVAAPRTLMMPWSLETAPSVSADLEQLPLRCQLYSTEDSNAVIRVGSITYNEKELMVAGRHGTLVYKGQCSRRPAAISRVLYHLHSEAMREKAVRIMIQLSENEDNEGRSRFIIRYHDDCVDEKFWYMATELCDCSLASAIANINSCDRKDTQNSIVPFKQSTFMPSKASIAALTNDPIGICRQLVSVVSYMHANHTTHGALRPSNILLKQGVVKVTNFVNAILHDPEVLLQESSELFSTMCAQLCQDTELGWLPIDMFQKIDDPTAFYYADVFALGCIIFYILSGGHHPYGSSSFRVANIARGHISPYRFLVSETSLSSPFQALKVGSLSMKTPWNNVHSNVPQPKMSMNRLMGARHESAAHLVRCLCDPIRIHRMSAHDALRHPLFWSPRQQIETIAAFSDVLKRLYGVLPDSTKVSNAIAQLESAYLRYEGDDPSWVVKLSKRNPSEQNPFGFSVTLSGDGHTKSFQKGRSSITSINEWKTPESYFLMFSSKNRNMHALGLCRAIRNIAYAHAVEYVAANVFKSVETIHAYFTDAFPWLAVEIFDIIHSNADPHLTEELLPMLPK